jgi:rSAM/selenodomain-associated transferase 1
VKTRLIGSISASEAADLHEAFVADLVERLQGREFDLRIAWALDPGDLPPQEDSTALTQTGKDLGERLFNALQEVGQSYSRVAAIGSDHPEIPAERLERAFDLLEEHDIVIGPARDGGYYLIASRAKRLDRALFDGVEWSSSRVLEQTLRRAKKLGLHVGLLEEGDDVDAPEDLERLARFLSSREHDCPSTEILLRKWGMLT